MGDIKIDFDPDDSKIRMLEAFKRLEFTIEGLKEKAVNLQGVTIQIKQENLVLEQEISRLKKENQYLLQRNREVFENVDFAIKVTEDILGRTHDEN